MHNSDSNWQTSLPRTPVQKWTKPLARFLRMEAASGVVLLLCTAIALAFANSTYAETYTHFWHTETGFVFGEFRWVRSLEFWVNDGLMMIFFFVIGLEIKREIAFGELRELRKAALPILGAIGGMLAPAAIYFTLQAGQPGESGWGIPMATDIAFVVGILALLGTRVPFGLKIFLLSLAIADDIGAILVIAIFYSKGILLPPLGIALIGFVLFIVLHVAGVHSNTVYCVVAVGIWLAVLRSGVHPTVAGVILGLLTPARPRIRPEMLTQVVSESLHHLRGSPGSHTLVVEPLLESARAAVSPLHRLESALHPWVAFAIMPIFALANAGVAIDLSAVRHPVALAVLLGLLIGKPLGIVGVSWLGVTLGVARLPSGINWSIMFAGGCLGGIGFTMSLFIANLAFDQAMLLDAAKLGTLAGSACSALVGCVAALYVLPKNATAYSNESAA